MPYDCEKIKQWSSDSQLIQKLWTQGELIKGLWFDHNKTGCNHLKF